MKKQDKKSEITRILADFELFAADNLKSLALETHDPQMKTKYEQIAGINRSFYEKLENEIRGAQKEKSIDKEINLIMRAYFVEKSLYTAICEHSIGGERPNIIDELVDRHTLILRELLTEANWRKEALQKSEE